jgi:glyoxylase-like metal-dependent hydrolase (beta-lactamase superfamily II)
VPKKMISVAFLVCAATMLGASSAAGPVAQIASDIYLIRGALPANDQPDGNSVILRGPTGLLVVDTGRHVEHTQEIIDFAKSQHLAIAVIVNTHWHLDHIGGNAMLRREFPAAKVYATDTLRDALTGFLSDYRQQLNQAIAQTQSEKAQAAYHAELAIIDSGSALAPDVIIDKSSPLTLVGRKLDMHLELHAVTAGDVWFVDKKRHVAIVGDLVTLPVPFFDTACPERWEQSLQHIAAASFKTLIPGHGEPMSRQGFETYRSAFSALRTCAASDRSAVECAIDWSKRVASLAKERDDARTNVMLDYYFKTLLRAPPQERRKYCRA